jgi:uncharacterized protein YbgA (DUF1722 family)/uncharacterized protein YbbK (DUF523 family)
MEPFVNYIYSCPEMEIGLPSPRQALRKIKIDKDNERLVFSLTGEDVTDEMVIYSEEKMKELKALEVDGFILKSRSPSCGIKDVKLYKSHGKSQTIPGKSTGVFGGMVLREFDWLMVEDEGRLTNFNIREHFLTNVFIKAKFREIEKSKKIKNLVKFHSDNKYLFMAFNQSQLKILGKIVANHEKRNIEEILGNYREHLSILLNTTPQQKRNVNVIMHILGYFSKYLNTKEKAYFLDLLEQYSKNQVPVSAVMSILRVWSIKYESEYLLGQTVFEPYPKELITVNDSGKGRV